MRFKRYQIWELHEGKGIRRTSANHPRRPVYIIMLKLAINQLCSQLHAQTKSRFENVSEEVEHFRLSRARTFDSWHSASRSRKENIKKLPSEISYIDRIDMFTVFLNIKCP